MSSDLKKLGTQISPSLLRRIGNDWYLPSANGRCGYFTIAAPWCSWCHRLAPDMENASLSYQFPSFYVDGDTRDGNKLMQEMGVQGFPSVFSIDKNNKLEKYHGDRTSVALGSQYQQNKGSQSGGGGFFSWFM